MKFMGMSTKATLQIPATDSNALEAFYDGPYTLMRVKMLTRKDTDSDIRATWECSFSARTSFRDHYQKLVSGHRFAQTYDANAGDDILIRSAAIEAMQKGLELWSLLTEAVDSEVDDFIREQEGLI